MDYFSNRDKNVFIINLPKIIDRGALMSRYSRAVETDIRNLWDKEFAGKEEKGEKFYERVFLEYGDESIAELVTAQVGIQNVSNIVSKIIEDGRIGLSYLEKSSRYVPYDQKINGRYLFAEPGKIGIPDDFASEYEEYCNSLFESYTVIMGKLISYIRENFQIENTEFTLPGGKQVRFGEDPEIDETLRKSYESAVRSRALDEVRFILPSSTLTNIGISGNARGFAHLLERLKSIYSEETQDLYRELMDELKIVFPKLIDTVESGYGLRTIEYMNKISDFIPEPIEMDHLEPTEAVELIKWENDDEAVNTVLAANYFQRSYGSFAGFHDIFKELSMDDKRKIVASIASLRKSRREKPDRSLEHINYTFQITTNFGAFRELQRHRILAMQRKLVSTDYGYDIPPFISSIPEALQIYKERMDEGKKLYDRIRVKDKVAAQYVVPFGYRYPVIVTTDLRELVYLTELRSTPQAHFDLRKISIELTEKVAKVNPSISAFFRFVNKKEEELGRLQAEVRKEIRKKKL